MMPLFMLVPKLGTVVHSIGTVIPGTYLVVDAMPQNWLEFLHHRRNRRRIA